MKKIPIIQINVNTVISAKNRTELKLLVPEGITSICGSFANAFNLPPDSLVTVILLGFVGGGYELLHASFYFCYLPLR